MYVYTQTTGSQGHRCLSASFSFRAKNGLRRLARSPMLFKVLRWTALIAPVWLLHCYWTGDLLASAPQFQFAAPIRGPLWEGQT